MLAKLLSQQKLLQEKGYGHDFSKLTLQEKERMTKDMVLCLTAEVIEFLNCIAWKVHRKQKVRASKKQLKEEFIDMLKFLLNIALIWDLDEKEIVQIFNKVNKRNWKRIRIGY